MELDANTTLNQSLDKKVTISPLSSLRFAQKDEQHEEDSSVTARLERLQRQFDVQGMRTTVEAVIVVQAHNHPHVLLIQIANSFFKLPGDYLQPGEDLISGLKAKLNQQLSRVLATDPSTNEPIYEGGDDWDIVECIGQWWRPNFETFLYPYLPPHITRPKENKKVFLVNVPPGRTLWIPRNLKVMAVPVFELAENSTHETLLFRHFVLPMYLPYMWPAPVFSSILSRVTQGGMELPNRCSKPGRLSTVH